jgi:hypothetical protein
MPSTTDIVAGLTEIANHATWVALLWHAAFALGLVVLAWGVRPSRRSAALLSLLPIVSVAVTAWWFGNPFNAVAFFVLAGVLSPVALRLPVVPMQTGRGPLRALGALMLGFGWTYPHFLAADTPWEYLYAAPLGLIPCPTLAAVIGLTLLARGFGSRSWSWILAAAGTLYAVFGVVRLGVWLDLGLLVGAVTLAGAARSWHRSCSTSRRDPWIGAGSHSVAQTQRERRKTCA